MLKTLKEYKNRTYVGYSTNIIARLEKHNASNVEKSSRVYKLKIIFKKRFLSKSKALSFEYLLKKDRKKRLSIIKDL
jgi:putative endonuclease